MPCLMPFVSSAGAAYKCQRAAQHSVTTLSRRLLRQLHPAKAQVFGVTTAAPLELPR